jgi:hypothetical protein
MEKNGHAREAKAEGDNKPAKEELHAPAEEGNATPKKRRKVNHGTLPLADALGWLRFAKKVVTRLTMVLLDIACVYCRRSVRHSGCEMPSSLLHADLSLFDSI